MPRISGQQKTILSLSVPLSVLVGFASIIALTNPAFYNAETSNWQMQALAQDYFDLFVVVPLLLVSATLFFKGNRIGMWTWGGTLLYLTYTFVIYCFDTHFNSLFIVYCLILGISFYSFVVFLFWQFLETFLHDVNNSYSLKTIGIYFIITSLLFGFLWLSEDIPALLQHKIPVSTLEAGLPTNPVHVLDLAIFLPGMFLTGILLLQKKPGGLILAPVLLTFIILMFLSIAGIIFMAIYNGFEGSNVVALGMLALAMVSTILLIWFAKKS